MILARLQAQWPGVAADEVGARDWLKLVTKTSREVGELACEDLITGWVKDRGPRPGDWQEACRSVAARLGSSGPALDDRLLVAAGDVRELMAGDPPGERRPVAEVMEELRDKLSAGSAKLRGPR